MTTEELTVMRCCGFCEGETPAVVAWVNAVHYTDISEDTVIHMDYGCGGCSMALLRLSYGLYVRCSYPAIQFNPPRPERLSPIAANTSLTIPRCERCRRRQTMMVELHDGTASVNSNGEFDDGLA